MTYDNKSASERLFTAIGGIGDDKLATVEKRLQADANVPDSNTDITVTTTQATSAKRVRFVTPQVAGVAAAAVALAIGVGIMFNAFAPTDIDPNNNTSDTDDAGDTDTVTQDGKTNKPANPDETVYVVIDETDDTDEAPYDTTPDETIDGTTPPTVNLPNPPNSDGTTEPKKQPNTPNKNAPKDSHLREITNIPFWRIVVDEQKKEVRYYSSVDRYEELVLFVEFSGTKLSEPIGVPVMGEEPLAHFNPAGGMLDCTIVRHGTIPAGTHVLTQKFTGSGAKLKYKDLLDEEFGAFPGTTTSKHYPKVKGVENNSINTTQGPIGVIVDSESAIIIIHEHFTEKQLADALSEIPKDIKQVDLFCNSHLGRLTLSLAPLRSFTNLETLYIGGLNIGDASALVDLPNLGLLMVSDCVIDNDVLTQIGKLTSLYELRFASINLGDISALKNLKDLKSLVLQDCKVNDISALKNLKNLRHLYLEGVGITDISPLRGLTGLVALYLPNNNIVDISPLRGLTNLEVVDVSDNKITDFSPLDGLKQKECYSLKI
ncbi:MAG: leucine-rich repeat domain-containing protein [Oscillospiraceae bacterium]|nr:leucine-rich repeat domain-containing protein [Oscillospiraceae bacterium]